MSAPDDWAIERAREILRDVARAGYGRNVEELIAARLRLVRTEGERAGIAQVSAAMDDVFRKPMEGAHG